MILIAGNVKYSTFLTCGASSLGAMPITDVSLVVIFPLMSDKMTADSR